MGATPGVQNRGSQFSEGVASLDGCDFRIATTDREHLYEVKATPYDGSEFKLTDAECRSAAAVAEPSKDYRIPFVQHAFDPARWRVLGLPNPAGRKTRENFRIVGRSFVRSVRPRLIADMPPRRFMACEIR